MARPKLTAEQLEERKEKERLRSQQRRQAAAKERQTRLFHEAGLTPTVRIIETEVAEPTHTANNTITNPQPQLTREETREDNNGCFKPTDITEESVDYQETATIDLFGQKQTQVKDCTVNQGPVSSLSPAPAEQAQRYNLRTRKSPTPTDQSFALRPSSSSSAANNRVRPDCFNLPLRPIANPNGKPRHASSRAQTSDEEEPHDELQQCQVPPASLGAPNASARRVQQCRARQRALRREQHVLDANQRPSQVRVVSFPHDEPPHAPFADISQPEPQEAIIGGEQGGHGGTTSDSNFDETLVESTILVAGDEVSSPRPGCEQGGTDVDDDPPDRAASASAEEAGEPNGALHDSLEQEQGLFTSDDDSLSVPSANGSGTPSSDNVLNGAGEASSQLRNHPPERPTHSPSFLPLLSPTRTCLDEAVAAIVSSESTAGLEFIARQGIAYKRIFREAFSLICGCRQHSEQEQPSSAEGAFSIREMSQWFRTELGCVDDILRATSTSDQHHQDPSQARQWEKFLAAGPAPLSLSRSESPLQGAGLPQVERAWDIDSIWLGATSLQAIRPQNNSFRLSFLPPYMRSIAGNQAIQPHGIDLGHTRHTYLGSFYAGGVPMDIFVFFPNTNDGEPVKPRRARQKRSVASPYTLSLERQKDLLDGAILPAVRSSLAGLHQQEIPPTFDIANAKSKSYQETPSTNQWRPEDLSRAIHLRYAIPGNRLGAFWRDFKARCDQLRISTTRGPAEFAYFQDPKLLFQVHDTKNVFAQPTLAQSLDLFVDSVQRSLDPNFLDFRSCWLDIGFRDMPGPYLNHEEGHGRPVTLLWKKSCLQHFHSQIATISPAMQLKPEYFRAFQLRDAATYTSKARGAGGRVPRPSDPGNPNCSKLGVVHAKSYNCDKERFSVLSRDYRPFSAPALAAMALNDSMVKDLFAAGHDHSRAVSGAPLRKRLEVAWEANKRHLRAVAEHDSPASGYAVRREITFRLDVILTMHRRGEFLDGDNSSSGGEPQADSAPGGAVMATLHQGNPHYPFWVLDTKEVNRFVSTLGCRFVKPLDCIFALGRLSNKPVESAKHNARSLVYFYTAQFFLRLLASSLHSEREWHSDKWIWEREWTSKQTKDGRTVRYKRCGLGLKQSIKDKGLLWIGIDQMDWIHSHLSISKLIHVYIPRNPQHPMWAAQSTVRGFAHTSVTAAYLIEDLLGKAAHIRQHSQASIHLAVSNEKKAVQVAAQEVAREYGKHLLSKLRVYWENTCGSNARTRRRLFPDGICTLALALKELQKPVGRMVTPQMLLDIFDEAWYMRQVAEQLDEPADVPIGIPVWMSKRSPKEQYWTRVVWQTLFDTRKEVTWSRNTFRVMHKRFKDLYEQIRHADATPFDDEFMASIGRYITVMFNPDKSKEVNTSHGKNFAYNHLPAFFRIQFWAPLVNPSRYSTDAHKVMRPTFPLAVQEKRSHRMLHLRNLAVAQSFRAVRELRITTSWLLSQSPHAVLEVADNLAECMGGLLRLTGPLRAEENAPMPPPIYWNFNSPESSDLGLWEVPIEGAISGHAMPTIIMPTMPILLFLAKAGRAVIGQSAVLEGAHIREAGAKLSRLRDWLQIAEGLIRVRGNRRCLVSTKLGMLEEVKSWYEDISSDDLLLQFINQAEAPQTCVYDDGEHEQIDETSDTEDELSRSDSQESADDSFL